MQDFDLTNKCGYMFLEPRSDGGIGVYVSVDTTKAKSVCLPLTRDEMLNMAGWLIAYIDATRKD